MKSKDKNVNYKGVFDPHGIERRYIAWRKGAKQIEGLDKEISDVLMEFLDDMQYGRNVSKGTKKGARSFSRLNGYKSKLAYLFKHLKKRGVRNIKCKNKKEWKELEKKLNDFFSDIVDGKVGNIKKSAGDYAKNFTSFWHWWMRINKRNGTEIPDITTDLDTSKNSESDFVYFEFEQMKQIMKEFSKNIALMLLFMFDSIVRPPKELSNIRRCDITEKDGHLWLYVRLESTKTYDRRFKLMLCSEELKKYLDENKFQPDDFIFKFSSPVLNKKLKQVVVKLFGDTMTLGGLKFSQISLYDFRHSGACYWRKGAYNTKIDSLMYRGGWKDLRMLNYYTKRLGMKDTISDDDMLSFVDKNKLEKEIDDLKTKVSESEVFRKKFNQFLKLLKDSPEAVDEIIKKQGKAKVIEVFK